MIGAPEYFLVRWNISLIWTHFLLWYQWLLFKWTLNQLIKHSCISNASMNIINFFMEHLTNQLMLTHQSTRPSIVFLRPVRIGEATGQHHSSSLLTNLNAIPKRWNKTPGHFSLRLEVLVYGKSFSRTVKTKQRCVIIKHSCYRCLMFPLTQVHVFLTYLQYFTDTLLVYLVDSRLVKDFVHQVTTWLLG